MFFGLLIHTRNAILFRKGKFFAIYFCSELYQDVLFIDLMT